MTKKHIKFNEKATLLSEIPDEILLLILIADSCEMDAINEAINRGLDGRLYETEYGVEIEEKEAKKLSARLEKNVKKAKKEVLKRMKGEKCLEV